ncbi:MAG: hydrogenase 2 operon protein HybA [Mucispirillum sp.]|nr:hydrogenase 2 operon protein HybA [Mucispirillum sp.]
MKASRRDFFKIAAGGVAAAGIIAPSEAKASSEDEDFAPGTMVKMYDSTKCIGCQSCVVACYEANFINRPENYIVPKEERNFIENEDVIPKLSPEDEFNPQAPWLNVVGLDYRFRTVIQKYVDENGNANFIKRNCMHCKKPGCVSACPVSALQKDPEDGVVTYDPNRCIGCRYCQMACPFNIPTFEWHRAIPKITKCDMCRSNIHNKESGRVSTACVHVCPTGAVVYGKRSDLLKEAHRRIEESKQRGENKYYEDTARGESVLGEKIYGGTGELVLAATDFRNLGYPVDKIGDRATAYKSENIQHTIYKYGIAPVALYAALALVIRKNNKKHHDDH